MTSQPANAVSVQDQSPESDALRRELVDALLSEPPFLPAKLHYDEIGSQLFEQICEQPEYYLTRTEAGIMDRFGAEIAAEVGSDVAVVEPGSGASTKTEILIESLEDCAAYIPSDISDTMLELAANRVAARFPGLKTVAVHADFLDDIELPKEAQLGRSRLVYFPGSTIGNFNRQDQTAVLRSFRRLAGENGMLLVGYDREKSIERMEAAYNDAAGVTSEFNLNMLDRLCNEFGIQILRDDFEFRAEWNSDESAIVSHVHALRDIEIKLEGGVLQLPAGGRIQTEQSHKYTPERFASLAESAGLGITRTWTDENEDFAVALLTSS